jgi:4-hydroxyphenylpyruvate dioxygenase
VAFGTANVPAAVTSLRQQGLEFMHTATVKPTDRGAITQSVLRTVVFELVHDVPQ